MSREGRGGSKAPGIWRPRTSLALLALAVFGASQLITAPSRPGHPQPAREAAVPGADADSVAWLTEVGALAALGKAALRRRSGKPSPTRARAPEARVERPGELRPGLPSGPGPAHELLALFALPRPLRERIEVPQEAPADDPHPAAAADPPGGSARTELPMLRLYGPLAIEGADGAGLRRRATRGLIAYLALHRGPASFEELAEVLWPGEDFARTRLRLFKAKQLAQPIVAGALERCGAGYCLDAARLRFDIAEIDRLDTPSAGLDSLERAVSLSAGAPLADVDYPFAESERRRLQSLRLDLLARVSAARLRAGEARTALVAAEELIAIDGLNELGWRLAMQAEAGLGARQAIIDRYELLGAELDRALGLRPQAETRATYRRLLGQD